MPEPTIIEATPVSPGWLLVSLDPACGSRWAVLAVGGLGASHCYRSTVHLTAEAKQRGRPGSALVAAARIAQEWDRRIERPTLPIVDPTTKVTPSGGAT